MDQKLKSFFLDLAIAFAVCFPVLRNPARWLLGSPDVDVWNHVWGPWWWAHSFRNGQLPWSTNLLQAPDGGTLWFIDPILAGLGWPIALLSPVLSYNMMMLLYVAFASWAIRFFARSLGADQRYQWLASATFATSGWMISELHNGITEAVNIGVVALALGCTERACRDQSRPYKAWLIAGAAIGLAMLASPYLGLGAGIAAVIRGLPAFRRAWIGAISTAVVALPPLLALRAQLSSTDAIIKRPEGMNEQLALHNAVDPRTFVTPFGFQSVDLSSEGFHHTMYFGIFALWLSTQAWKAHKLWVTAALLCVVFSLGPYLYWGNGWLTVGENPARLRMPWFFLQQLAPGLAVTHPLRLAVPALAIIAALAAAGAQVKWRSFGRWMVLILIDNLLLGGHPWPVAVADAQLPAVYSQIEAKGQGRIVLDLPTDAGETMGSSRYLYYQSAHSQGIPYGPDARASTASLLRNQSFRYLASLCRRRADEHKRLGLSRSGQHGVSVQQLRAENVGWIVLHHSIDPSVTPALKQFLESQLGAGETTGSATMWTLSSSPTGNGVYYE